MAPVSLIGSVGRAVTRILPVACVLAIGCGGGAPGPAVELDSRLGDTLLTISSSATRPLPAPGDSGGAVGGMSAADSLAPSPGMLVAGWRIQVFADPRLVEAERVREEARRAVGLPAYVEYRAPLYRVRLGDFLDRGEAEAAQARVVAAGYENAGVVATLVLGPFLK